MGNQAFWLQVIDTSAAMLGFTLVVMGLVIVDRKENSTSASDARVLMYSSFASFLAFVVSLGIAVYISLTDTSQTIIGYVGVIYFGLGFAIGILTLGLIIATWIRRSG